MAYKIPLFNLNFDEREAQAAYDTIKSGWITADKLRELAQPMIKNQYGQYLLHVIEEVERTGKANLCI